MVDPSKPYHTLTTTRRSQNSLENSLETQLAATMGNDCSLSSQELDTLENDTAFSRDEIRDWYRIFMLV